MTSGIEPAQPPTAKSGKSGQGRTKQDPLAGLTREALVDGYVTATGAKRRQYVRRLEADDPTGVAEAVGTRMRSCVSLSGYNALGKLALKLDTPALRDVLAREAQTQPRYSGTAVRVLGRSTHPRRDELLIEILSGPRGRAARSAVQAILERPTPSLVIPLCRIALGQVQPHARHQATRLLAMLGGHAALARMLLSQAGRSAPAVLSDLEFMLQVKVGRSLFGFNLARFMDKEASDARSPVRAQAAAVLRAINDRATLLRPASGAADTLLRPAESAELGPADHLLRPANSERALDD